MPSYLLLQNGSRLLLQGSGALLLQADGDAPASVGPRQSIVWREANYIAHRDGGPTVGRLAYSAHAEDPGPGVWWRSRANTLIDFTGYSFVAKINDGVTSLVTKTTGITGAAGAGSAPDGTPNIAIDWDADELDIAPGEYTLELTPSSSGRQRNPLRVPIRIIASAP